MDDVKNARFNLLRHRYGSFSSASSYRSEINYQIANPSEEEFTQIEISKLKVIRAELNEYLEFVEAR